MDDDESEEYKFPWTRPSIASVPRKSNSRLVFGSLLSALVGWMALGVCTLVLECLQYYAFPKDVRYIFMQTALADYEVTMLFGAGLIFVTWFIVLLPLYSLVPLKSRLWKWPICTICGVLSGALIMAIFSRISSPATVHSDQFVGPCALAGIVGGVTCLFGSLTKHRFQNFSKDSGK
jgi:hypothetical protein